MCVCVCVCVLACVCVYKPKYSLSRCHRACVFSITGDFNALFVCICVSFPAQRLVTVGDVLVKDKLLIVSAIDGMVNEALF